MPACASTSCARLSWCDPEICRCNSFADTSHGYTPDTHVVTQHLPAVLQADAAAHKHLAPINSALTERTEVIVNLGTFKSSGAGLHTLLHSVNEYMYDSDLDAG